MEILETHNNNGPESFVFSLSNQILHIWPQLTDTFDDVALIYAGFHPDFSFFTRKTDGIKAQVLEEYKSGKRRFMFECLGEGVSRDVLLKIHTCMDEFVNTHPDISVYYLTGANNSISIYNNVCIEENLTPYINMMECYYFDYVNGKAYPKYDIDYKVINRKKKFLCLNKVHRQHRIDLLELMLKEKLITDDCYYSFYDGSKASDDALLKLPLEHYPNITSNLDFIKTLRLNFDDTRVNPVDIRDEDLKLFNNSYFSVVTETLYHSNNYNFTKTKCHVSNVESGPFVTEKSTKVIALKHPFVMVSVPYMLQALRDRGYKTFHPYIDETYDTIEDDDLRLEYIVREIKRLTSQTNSEWLEWVRNIKPIVEHNYELFFNRTSYSA